MTALSQVIANRVGLFGPAPSDKWNAFNWGSFLWGEGTIDLAVQFQKLLPNSLSVSDSLAKTLSRQIANNLLPISMMSDEEVLNGVYYRLFPGGVQNGEDRASPSWSQAAVTAPTWTQTVASSTTWSAA